jgi:hypothetical protein
MRESDQVVSKIPSTTIILWFHGSIISQESLKLIEGPKNVTCHSLINVHSGPHRGRTAAHAQVEVRNSEGNKKTAPLEAQVSWGELMST